MGMSFYTRMLDRKMMSDLRMQARREGIPVEDLADKLAEDEAASRLSDRMADRMESDVLPAFAEDVVSRFLSTLKEVVDKYSPEVIYRASRQIAAEIVSQLPEMPRGVTVGPGAGDKKFFEKLIVERLPISDLDAILDHIAETNRELAE